MRAFRICKRSRACPGSTRRKAQRGLFLGSPQEEAASLLLGAHVSYRQWQRQRLFLPSPASIRMLQNIASLPPAAQRSSFPDEMPSRPKCPSVLECEQKRLLPQCSHPSFPQTPQGRQMQMAPPQRGHLNYSLGCAGHTAGGGGSFLEANKDEKMHQEGAVCCFAL